MCRPVNCGMWGIKLVSPQHFSYPFFHSVMNFPDSPKGRGIAQAVPIGYKAVVYETSPRMRFTAAIEFIACCTGVGVLAEGNAAAASCGAANVLLSKGIAPRWTRVWRCIRILKMATNPATAPTRNAMEQLARQSFRFRQGDIMFDISQSVYDVIFNAL